LIDHPGFELDILLTMEEEVRVHRPGQAWRRKGWVVLGRALVEVAESLRIRSSADLVHLLPTGLPEPFTTAHIAGLAGVSRRVAQHMAYCLRATGAIEMTGKEGNSVLYRRTA
jgi:hypothetical protein